MRIILMLLFVLGVNYGTIGQEVISKIKYSNSSGKHSESFQSLSFNGSWNNFADSKAVYYQGKYARTYAGWIDNYGNVTVGSYDHKTQKIVTHVVKENFEVNDHCNPSILFDKDGKLIVFFTKSDCETSPILFVKTIHSEDITKWENVQEVSVSSNESKSPDSKKISDFYINSIRLKSEENRIYLFAKGTDESVLFTYSDDAGTNWSKGKELITKSSEILNPKVYSNGDKKIHLTFTVDNSMYYTYYENGVFYKADGSKIKNVSELPLKISDLDVVYQNSKNTINSLCYDIAENDKSTPVIAYATINKNNELFYSYANWTGHNWVNRTLIKSDQFISAPKEPTKGSQIKYSGGISIDQENPNQLYLSVKRDSVFEIEKWVTRNNGKSWKVDFITKGSEKDNIRPFAVLNAKEGNPIQLLWMQNTKYPSGSFEHGAKLHWADRFQSSIQMDIQSPKIDNAMEPTQILDIMRQTADWQFQNPYDLRRLGDWHWGTYYVGLQAFYDITKEDRYKQEMINIGDGENWKIHDKILYADMLTVISNWAWLYGKEKRPEMIEHSKWVCDVHLATRRAYKADVTFAGNPYFDEWWTWCDALFVAPPAFARMALETDEKKYLDYADRMFWITSDYLYCKEDSLMYRDDRYFKKLSENGKKIYWGRGNGWVISGIARMITLMPEDYPSREKYISMYKEMAAKIIDLQCEDGGWRVSLLDPEYQDVAEMSGSAFYVYALAWGLNNEFLDEKYRSVVDKGWKTLCQNVNENGRFGNVQPEGIDPRKFTPENWQVYGTGAFLMAGVEMYKLVGGKIKK